MTRKTEKQDPRAALDALAEAFADETVLEARRAHHCRLELEMLLVELRWGLDMLRSRVGKVASEGDAADARQAMVTYLLGAAEAVKP